MDIGCGSGLFSIAAHQLGAKEVMGIDINPLLGDCFLAEPEPIYAWNVDPVSASFGSGFGGIEKSRGVRLPFEMQFARQRKG